MKDLADKYILAIDHGTSGVKAALVAAAGEIIGFESEPTPVAFLPGGGAEQDPEQWWRALLAAAGRLIARGLCPADHIVAVCCSSTFSSTVAVGADGSHLGPSLTWMDSRGAPYIREVVSGFPSVMGYNLRAMLPWIYKTGGGPQLSGKDDCAHVLWWKHERPDIYKNSHMFMGSKDYLNLRLTGRFAASYDAMTLFWVVNARDIAHPRYDAALLGRLGIDPAKLPPMRRSIDPLGPLLPEAARALGLGPEVQVICGSPDHQAACIGSGAVRDFEGHLYVGTSSWVQCVVPFKKTDVLHSIASLPTAIPGKYYAVNEQDVAGGALGFLIDNILCRPGPLRREGPPEDAYGRLDELAAGSPAGSRGVIFAPWLNGERTPVDDPDLRAGFYNLGLTTTAEDLARAALEGVALNTRWSLSYVEKFIGRKMDPLNFVGGGARSELWCQIFADVMDRTIRQVKDPMQANARGAAWIAAVGLGLLSFSDLPGLTQYSRTFTPDPARRGLYDRRFREFLEIYRNNRAMFRRLNQRRD